MKNILILIVLTLILLGFGITGIFKAVYLKDWILAVCVMGQFFPLLFIMIHSFIEEWRRYKYFKRNGI